jgi:hypothetical protein
MKIDSRWTVKIDRADSIMNAQDREALHCMIKADVSHDPQTMITLGGYPMIMIF